MGANKNGNRRDPQVAIKAQGLGGDIFLPYADLFGNGVNNDFICLVQKQPVHILRFKPLMLQVFLYMRGDDRGAEGVYAHGIHPDGALPAKGPGIALVVAHRLIERTVRAFGSVLGYAASAAGKQIASTSVTAARSVGRTGRIVYVIKFFSFKF